MIRDGRCQWTSDYPSPDIIRHDIDQGHAFVIENEGKITTYGVIAINAEPAYSQPSAHWLSHGDYFVIHRLAVRDRKSTRLNSSHANISYAVFCLKKKNPAV